MDEFTCCKCNTTYLKRNDEEWNDLKAAEELLTLFPETRNDPVNVLCDDCFQDFNIWFSRFSDEEKKQMRDNFYNENPEYKNN